MQREVEERRWLIFWMLVTPTILAGLQNIPISADYDHSNDDFAVWFVPFFAPQ